MDADFQLLIDDTLSEAAQVSQYIKFALEAVREAQRYDEQILNRAVEYKTYVDGALSAIENVRSLSDTIEFEFSVTEDIVGFILDELQKLSPVGSGTDPHPGQYKSSHILFADGILVEDPTKPPQAHEYTFVSTLPYARKIEGGEGHRPQSDQAPQGVYEVTAMQANARFGNSAKIYFEDYTGTYGVMAESTNATYGRHTTLQHNRSENRYPSIVVMM